MTNRAEIERLLDQTGRTLEGLPVRYSDRERDYAVSLIGLSLDAVGDRLCHQSDVIDLLVGALRDALDKQPKWISVKERLPVFPCICWDGVNRPTVPKSIATITLKNGKVVCVTDVFLQAFPDAVLSVPDDCTHILYWMPLPEPPEVNT